MVYISDVFFWYVSLTCFSVYTFLSYFFLLLLFLVPYLSLPFPLLIFCLCFLFTLSSTLFAFLYSLLASFFVAYCNIILPPSSQEDLEIVQKLS
jgi:hypothetical protein